MSLWVLVLAAAAPASTSPAVLPPVVALPDAPPKKLDPAAVAEAIRYLDVQDFDKEIARTTQLAIDVTLAGMVERIQKNSGDEVPEEFIAELKTTMRDHELSVMRTNLPSIKRQAAEIYAAEFTAAELIHLRELAADPVLAKARQRLAVMQPKLMMVGIKVMRDAQPELEAKIKRLISDYLAKKEKQAAKSTS